MTISIDKDLKVIITVNNYHVGTTDLVEYSHCLYVYLLKKKYSSSVQSFVLVSRVSRVDKLETRIDKQQTVSITQFKAIPAILPLHGV